MRFIVDTQLPPGLARFLELKGHDCIHTTHFDNGHLLQDADIIAIAIDQRRTIISKDADFLTITTLKEHHQIFYYYNLATCQTKAL